MKGRRSRKVQGKGNRMRSEGEQAKKTIQRSARKERKSRVESKVKRKEKQKGTRKKG